MKQVFKLSDHLHGRARLSHCPGGERLQSLSAAFTNNVIMKDWATVFANFATSGDSRFRITAMYLEFMNVPTAGEAVAVPAFGPDEGIEYFDSLASDPSRDYLRVFLSGSSVDTSDPDMWPSGNITRFFGMTSGSNGVHGKPFSDVNNSTVYGGALVVVRDVADATQDLIVSRIYFDDAEQQVKLATSQIGMDWEIEFN